MADPERLGLSVAQIAEKFDMSVATIYNLIRDPEIAEKIKLKRAHRVEIELPKVDQAMVKEAVAGNVRAAELVYERWDGYLRGERDQAVNIWNVLIQNAEARGLPPPVIPDGRKNQGEINAE